MQTLNDLKFQGHDEEGLAIYSGSPATDYRIPGATDASCDNAAESWNDKDNANYGEGMVKCERGSYRGPDAKCLYCEYEVSR